MNITTKFNLDESAWYMQNNKPVEVLISAVRTFHVGTNQDKITYSAKDVENSVSWIDHEALHEEMLYKTKSDLIMAVFGSYECKGIDLGDGNFSGCNASDGDCPECGK